MTQPVAVLLGERRNVFLRIRQRGYQQLYVWIKGKRVALARYLYEKYVRPLRQGEVVHHRDGNSRNCSLLNLYGCAEELHLQIHAA